MLTVSPAPIILSVAGIRTRAAVPPGRNSFLTGQTVVSGPRSAALWDVVGIACGAVV